MILVGDACEGRGWLSLTASTDNYYLLWLKLICILRSDKHALGNVEVTQFDGHLHIILHASANQCNKALIALSSVNNLLNTRDERCKSSNQDAPGCIREDLIQRLIDHTLRECIAWRFHPCTIAHHDQYTFV